LLACSRGCVPVAKEYLEDGVSWRDGMTFCYTDAYIEEHVPEKNRPYVRKWNCTEPETTLQSVAIGGSKFVDALFGQVGTYLDFGEHWGEGRVLMSHVDGDGHYTTPSSFKQDVIDYVYKVLHAGSSLVFGAPMLALISIMNRGLTDSKVDPALTDYAKTSNVPSALISFFRDRFADWVYPQEDDWNPIADSYNMELFPGDFNPISGGIFWENGNAVTFDAITLP
jgi:hypothetical protein